MRRNADLRRINFMSDKRVVITGMGCLTPCGNSPEELWDNLLAGKHGFELDNWFPEEPDTKGIVARVKNRIRSGALSAAESAEYALLTRKCAPMRKKAASAFPCLR